MNKDKWKKYKTRALKTGIKEWALNLIELLYKMELSRYDTNALLPIIRSEIINSPKHTDLNSCSLTLPPNGWSFVIDVGDLFIYCEDMEMNEFIQEFYPDFPTMNYAEQEAVQEEYYNIAGYGVFDDTFFFNNYFLEQEEYLSLRPEQQLIVDECINTYYLYNYTDDCDTVWLAVLPVADNYLVKLAEWLTDGSVYIKKYPDTNIAILGSPQKIKMLVSLLTAIKR